MLDSQIRSRTIHVGGKELLMHVAMHVYVHVHVANISGVVVYTVF